MLINFHMGMNLRCYGNVEIEAESVEAALPLLTADFLASNITITETTTDSGQDLAIIDVSDAETGEDIEGWDDAHFLPSPYDPQPDAELLAALRGLAGAIRFTEVGHTVVEVRDIRQCHEAALAAIVKAEGRANG